MLADSRLLAPVGRAAHLSVSLASLLSFFFSLLGLACAVSRTRPRLSCGPLLVPGLSNTAAHLSFSGCKLIPAAKVARLLRVKGLVASMPTRDLRCCTGSVTRGMGTCLLLLYCGVEARGAVKLSHFRTVYAEGGVNWSRLPPGSELCDSHPEGLLKQRFEWPFSSSHPLKSCFWGSYV